MEYLHLLRQFLTDILQTNSWISLRALDDISLKNLVPNMMELQLGARASSTVRKYRAAWLKWRTWALSKTDVPVIPAQPAHVALFITELANTARVKGLGFSTLEVQRMELLGLTKWVASPSPQRTIRSSK